MASRLEELNGQIAAKREELGAIFKAKPNKDYTTEELAKIQGLNTELSKLAGEQEPLANAYKIERETLDFLEKNNPVGETLPGGGERTATGVKLRTGETLNLRDERGNLLPDSKIAEQLNEMALKSVQNAKMKGGGGLGTFEVAEDIAESFIKSAAFTGYNAGEKKSPAVEMDVKTLLNTTGFPVASVRSGMMVQYPLRRLTIADLFPSGNITQPAFVYMEETTFTNNAAATAEAGTKPESALAFTERSAPVRKIATVLPVTDELFQDAPAMRAYVQGRMTVFLQLAEENELLNGSGTAPHILGIFENGGISTQAKGVDTIVDCIYKGLTKVETVSFLPPSGIVLHPNDWMRVRLSKDSTGQYLFGSPMISDVERVFGYPVVKSMALTEGQGLVGAFDLAAMILRRTGIQFAVSTEHADFFIKNQLMLRIEERLSFPVFRPSGFCELTGLDA